MPNKSLAVSVDLTLYSVSCPGVILKDREDIFVDICVFGLHKQSIPVPAIFPLYFNERFKFRKVFYNCVNPLELHESLSNETVTIEVIQKSRFIHAGVVLANLEMRAKDFLFPYPSQVPVYSGADRELLLTKTLHFSGISPKVEFASVTAVNEVHTTASDELNDKIHMINREGTTGGSENRNRSPSPSRGLSRSKSMTNLKANGLCHKPPFVVRKVDKDILKTSEPMAATEALVRPSRSTKKRKGTKGKRAKSSQGVRGFGGGSKSYMVEKHFGPNAADAYNDYDDDEYDVGSKYRDNGVKVVNFSDEDDYSDNEALELKPSRPYSSAPLKKSYDDLRAERYLKYDLLPPPPTTPYYTSVYSDVILERLDRKRMLEELEREARISRLHSPYVSGSEKYAEKYEQELYWARKRRELERSLDRLYDRLYRL
ncbi:uncharacterized protein LOC134848031 [Symsagittifera roscoffensis]|uniref:uncharacterized protein LOC134848031 n=1 Tax=Symsagittifera roscoffensis TaxID=84072 RepID=UPI00307CA097